MYRVGTTIVIDPVNGGSRPWKEAVVFASWREYWNATHPGQNPHGLIRDLIDDEMVDEWEREAEKNGIQP